jgi:hypothetical protein
MKRYLISVAVVAVLGSAAGAQEPQLAHATHSADDQQISLTPEMLVYLQALRRHDDPKQAVRRKAEIKAAQRRARLSAMQWFGYSNQRPQASPTPFMGTYSPVWTGNTWDPYRWAGVGQPFVTVRVENVPYPR